MNKMSAGKNRMWHRLILVLLSSFIPFIILMLSFLALHIAPFGDHMLVMSDAKGMYVSDLSFIARALRGQEDLLYSFQSGIGTNMLGELGNFLNPANVIVLFFDIFSYPDMYSLLIAIDIAMCGLTMFLFLSGVYDWKGINLFFSTAYALMGFNVAYCFHFNFILSPELLPLIAFGINKILKGNSPWLYIISLGYAIFASFYFGFMLCIASVVIFLFWYVRDHETLVGMRRKIWINYTVASLVAGLLPAIVWIAALLSISGGRMEQNSILDFTFMENMSLADFGAKFFIGANNISEEINGHPNVFIGCLGLFLNFAFFLDRRNTTRKKVVCAVPLVFYFITFYIKAFSMAVQGFTATNWFNYRYSFVFSFLMLLIAYEEFPKLRDIATEDFKRTCYIFALFIILIFSQRFSFVTGGGMLLSITLLALSLGVIWWNRVNPVRAPTNLLAILLVLLCSIESYANFVVCTGNLQDWGDKKAEYQDDLFYGSVLSESVQQSDPGFFRMENEHKTDYDASNDPRLFGYNGVTYFGSFEPTFVYQGLSKLGLSWWANRTRYNEGRPNVFDSLLGLKYVIAERALDKEKGYDSLVTMGDKYTLFRNPYALPIAIVAAKDASEISFGLNPFENHNILWKSLTGQKQDVFDQQSDITFTYHTGNDGAKIDWGNAKAFHDSVMTSASSSDEEEQASSSVSENLIARNVRAIQNGSHIECTFTAEHDGPVYGYCGLKVDDNYGYAGDAMYYIGSFHVGDTVSDYIPITDSVNENLLNMLCAEYAVGYPNTEVLLQYSSKLQETSGVLEKLSDSNLAGHFSALDDGRLFFTIPYDEGWTLTVDGIETPLLKTADLFMVADICAGDHSYKLRFIPKGMKTGKYVSCCGILLLILLVIYNLKNKTCISHRTCRRE